MQITSSLSVTVYVEDVNDHAPVFVAAPYHVTVDELTPVGEYTEGWWWWTGGGVVHIDSGLGESLQCGKKNKNHFVFESNSCQLKQRLVRSIVGEVALGKPRPAVTSS
jgi:hypothetical protein